ncbi:hypothetical protein CLV30_1335 [Haloactinopolyspora alba]|uniref:Uncharacterized protein n=1 Tax=Haloactinopolyspora alba TaxID=648780 RepID=A0A2P8D3T4_9ACTN|nr:hypothetical protein [Haloactinopolyspora alba]PSK91872.1 hypothetical protein CLV30_1335 [Haloactinopolyspora alba]
MRPRIAQIRRVDETLCELHAYRRRCGDPVEVIRTTEKIDSWLDERLSLMRERNGYREGRFERTAP